MQPVRSVPLGCHLFTRTAPSIPFEACNVRACIVHAQMKHSMPLSSSIRIYAINNMNHNFYVYVCHYRALPMFLVVYITGIVINNQIIRKGHSLRKGLRKEVKASHPYCRFYHSYCNFTNL